MLCPALLRAGSRPCPQLARHRRLPGPLLLGPAVPLALKQLLSFPLFSPPYGLGNPKPPSKKRPLREGPLSCRDPDREQSCPATCARREGRPWGAAAPRAAGTATARPALGSCSRQMSLVPRQPTLLWSILSARNKPEAERERGAGEGKGRHSPQALAQLGRTGNRVGSTGGGGTTQTPSPKCCRVPGGGSAPAQARQPPAFLPNPLNLTFAGHCPLRCRRFLPMRHSQHPTCSHHRAAEATKLQPFGKQPLHEVPK